MTLNMRDYAPIPRGKISIGDLAGFGRRITTDEEVVSDGQTYLALAALPKKGDRAYVLDRPVIDAPRHDDVRAVLRAARPQIDVNPLPLAALDIGGEAPMVVYLVDDAFKVRAVVEASHFAWLIHFLPSVRLMVEQRPTYNDTPLLFVDPDDGALLAAITPPPGLPDPQTVATDVAAILNPALREREHLVLPRQRRLRDLRPRPELTRETIGQQPYFVSRDRALVAAVDEEGLNLTVAGERFGLSRQRAHQIYTRAKREGLPDPRSQPEVFSSVGDEIVAEQQRTLREQDLRLLAEV